MTTRTQQQVAVGQGLALGCLHRDIVGIPRTNFDIETTFRKAWESWPGRSTFPLVRSNLYAATGSDIQQILNKSRNRRAPMITFWWQDGPWHRPHMPEPWEWDDAPDMCLSLTDRPLTDWVDLADSLIEALGPERVDRDTSER